MRELARRLGQIGGWFSTQCKQCQEPFDFELDLSQLPVKEADNSPYIEVAQADRRLRFRLPNGEDQKGLLAFSDERQAQRWLLLRCLLDPDEAFC